MMSKPMIFRNSALKARVGVVAGVVLFSSLIATAAGASYGGTTIGNGVAPGAVAQGQVLLVKGTGYKGGETLTVVVDKLSDVIGHARTSAVGGFAANVKIPTNLSPGRHIIEFRGAGRNGYRVDKLVVVVHSK